MHPYPPLCTFTFLHLYSGAVTQDLAVDEYSTQKDQCSMNHIRGSTVTIKTPSTMQLQTAYFLFAHSKRSFLYLLMSACQRLQTCSPIKKILNKIGDSCQTYINYYKTHTMATGYGGIGDTSMINSEHHNMDAINYQADINDLKILNLTIRQD